MADSNYAQIGSKIQVNKYNSAGSPPGYDSLGKLRSVSGIGVELPEVESTTLDSDAEEFVGGLQRGKEITIMVPTNAQNIVEAELWGTGISRQLQAIWPAPTGKTRYFTVKCLGYEHDQITPSGLATMSLKGRITGAAPSETEPSH